MYAIGGSASPTINSQGNRYLAPANPFAKEVTLLLLDSIFITWLVYFLVFGCHYGNNVISAT